MTKLKLNFRLLLSVVIPLLGLLLLNLAYWLFPSLYPLYIFPLLRNIHDYTFGFLSIPNIYLALIIVFLVLIYIVKSKNSIVDKGLKICRLVCWLLFLFYFCWALLYKEDTVAQNLQLSIQDISNEELLESYHTLTNQLELLRKEIDTFDLEFKEIEELIRPNLERVLDDLGFMSTGRVRVRQIPAGILLRWNTSGIYIPHAFEGHVDGGLAPVQVPFTLAHEMAHGYGIAGESDCNFFAYLACRRTDNVFIQYAGGLSYWRYLASAVKRNNPSQFNELYENLDDQIKDDLASIRRALDEYPAILPELRDLIYDNYLKSHGVKDGIKSYARVVYLVESFKKKFKF